MLLSTLLCCLYQPNYDIVMTVFPPIKINGYEKIIDFWTMEMDAWQRADVVFVWMSTLLIFPGVSVCVQRWPCRSSQITSVGYGPF